MRSLIFLAAYGTIVYRVFLWGKAHYGWPAGAAVLAAAAAIVLVLWRRTMGGMLKGLAKREDAEQAIASGNFEKAEQLLLEGIEQARRSTNKASRGILHWDLVDLYIELERFDDAIDHLKEALAVTTGDTSPYGVQIQDCGPARLLDLYRNQERWADYEQYARQLIAAAEPRTAVTLHLELAQVLLTQGKPAQALEQAQAVEAALPQLPDLDAEDRLGILLQVAGIAWHARDPDRSLAASERLLTASQALPRDGEQRSYWLTLALTADAQALLLADDIRTAVTRAEEAVPVARTGGDTELHAHALFVLAKVLQTADDLAAARRAAQQALDLWESADQECNAGRARHLLAELAPKEEGVPSGATGD
jgi:tetratricopeptide (TPR) repeat protein